MNRPNSPYDNFMRSEATATEGRTATRKRSYCYASTKEEHLELFKEKSLIDLKNWRVHCRNMLQGHIDRKEHNLADYAEKCANLANRIDYIDEEIARREKIWQPTNIKANESMWKARLALIDEREAKRQRTEAPPTPTAAALEPFALMCMEDLDTFGQEDAQKE